MESCTPPLLHSSTLPTFHPLYLTNYRQYAKFGAVGSSKSQVSATFQKRSLTSPRAFFGGFKQGVVLPYETCREGGRLNERAHHWHRQVV